jgi:serine/threonine-protein kinase
MELVENAVIADRFRLIRLIGKGGMGSVWQARHLGLDIDCAIKFIEGEMGKIADVKARFEREAKAAAQLKSPHVVQVIDHGVFDGTPFIAMELLDGMDLSRRLAERRRLSPGEVNFVVGQVCRALSKAHAAGIVHRDLKPDNIFLVKDDDREIAKVLDFGIAKHANNVIEGSNTKTGALLGTPYYMSPEQAQGTKAIDHRSDLWSLAVIVFQCLTGHLPFQSEALGDLLVKIIVNPIPMPSQFAADLPPGFDIWWMKAASRDPKDRFQTAKEFNESLALALCSTVADGEPSATHNIPNHTVAMKRIDLPPQRPGTAPLFRPPSSGGSLQAANMALSPTPTPAPIHTPNPHQGTSGAPTFAGTDVPTGVPKRSNVPIVAGGLVGALVLALGIGMVAMKKKEPVHPIVAVTSPETADSTGNTIELPADTAVAVPQVQAMTPPTETTTTAATTTPTTAATTAPPVATTPKPPTWTPPHTPPPNNNPKPPVHGKPTQPKGNDLGF